MDIQPCLVCRGKVADNRVPFATYVALVRAAKDLCGDPVLPMRFAEAVDTSEFSVVGLLSLASETMHDSLMQLNRYNQLVVEVELQTTAVSLRFLDQCRRQA